MACLALWPAPRFDAAAELADRAGCTKRAAVFYISGERDPSVAALLALLNEVRGARR